MSSRFMNLRFALRQLMKAPGFTAAAALSLALGIGANVTAYTWLRQTVLDPLPGVHRSGELIAITSTDSAQSHQGVSYEDFKDMRDECDVLQGLFASDQLSANLQEDGRAQRIWAMEVTWNCFEVLKVQPQLGRFFTAADDQVGQPPVVVLSDSFWRRQFGADPEIVNRRIHINGYQLPVIGVAPKGFLGPISGLSFDVFVPVLPCMSDSHRHEQRDNRSFYVVGRLKAGVSFPSARRAIQMFSHELERRHPNTNTGIRAMVFPVSGSPNGAASVVSKPLKLLLLATAFILLIGCANVANLLLARSAGRQRELALRMALGSGRAQIVLQLLSENMVLGLLSGGLGVLLSMGCMGLFSRGMPPTHLPLVFRTHLDGASLIFAFVLSLLTAVLFGTLPALWASGHAPAEALKEGGSRSGGAKRLRIQSMLVTLEMAIAVALLSGAGLMVKSAYEIQNAKPGFEPEGVLHADLGLNMNGYDDAKAARFARQLLDRVQAMPGVESACFSESMPIQLEGPPGTGVDFEGLDRPSNEHIAFNRNLVSAGFFRTYRIPMTEGREFNGEDREGSQPVVIVNQSLAARFWPGQSPLGKRIRVWGDWRDIVGVAKDIKSQFWTSPTEPTVYLPLGQCGLSSWNLSVRCLGATSGFVKPLRAILLEMDPGLPVLMEDMGDVSKSSAFLVRTTGRALAGLGFIALFLASVGIYSVMAYSVSERTREIGIRMALGGNPTRILTLVLKRGLLLAVPGILFGMAGAYVLGHRLADLLFQTKPTEPFIFLGVPLILLIIALAACGIPGLRAACLKPVQALKEE